MQMAVEERGLNLYLGSTFQMEITVNLLSGEIGYGGWPIRSKISSAEVQLQETVKKSPSQNNWIDGDNKLAFRSSTSVGLQYHNLTENLLNRIYKDISKVAILQI